MLGKLIREARIDLGISQHDLAFKIKLTTRSYISAIEKELEIPSAKTLLKICKALNMNVDQAMTIYRAEKNIAYQSKINKRIKKEINGRSKKRENIKE